MAERITYVSLDDISRQLHSKFFKMGHEILQYQTADLRMLEVLTKLRQCWYDLAC